MFAHDSLCHDKHVDQFPRIPAVDRPLMLKHQLIAIFVVYNQPVFELHVTIKFI